MGVSSKVNLASVPDAIHPQLTKLVIDLIDDTIIAHADTPVIFTSG